jgi:hypothetical protein
LAVGAVTGFANSVGSQMIQHDSADIGWKGLAFAAVDGGVGLGGNYAGYGIAKGAGTTVGNAMSGIHGLWASAICGADSQNHGWDC